MAWKHGAMKELKGSPNCVRAHSQPKALSWQCQLWGDLPHQAWISLDDKVGTKWQQNAAEKQINQKHGTI